MKEILVFLIVALVALSSWCWNMNDKIKNLESRMLMTSEILVKITQKMLDDAIEKQRTEYRRGL